MGRADLQSAFAAWAEPWFHQRRLQRWTRTAIGLMVSAWAATAHAGDPAGAEALFREARALLVAGDHEGACRNFRASQALEPSAGALLNIADCDEKQGKSATAWAGFLAAAKLAGAHGQEPQRAEAQRRAAKLEATLVYLTVEVPHPVSQLEVRRDGVPLDPVVYGLRVPVDPGSHIIDVSAPGYRPLQLTVRVGDSPEVVRIGPLEPARATALAPNQPRTPAPEAAPRDSEPTTDDGGGSSVPWVIGGIGGALLLGGTAAGLLALDANSEAQRRCPSADRCSDPEVADIVDRRDTFATLADVGVGVGLAGIGTALVLLWTAPSESARSGLVVQPMVGRNQAGFSVREQF